MVMIILAVIMVVVSSIGLWQHALMYKKTKDKKEFNMYVLFLVAVISSIVVLFVSYIQYNTMVKLFG